MIGKYTAPKIPDRAPRVLRLCFREIIVGTSSTQLVDRVRECVFEVCGGGPGDIIFPEKSKIQVHSRAKNIAHSRFVVVVIAGSLA